ncbi:MAG: GUN4 domain-containing protein [Pleurocapsa sp. MO_192.B19]|nr:GUN4 domain-containing protein [Pleurocapsa sp. MO_192.B19]
MDGKPLPIFDVFLAHNSVDKPQVRAIARELKKRGLNPWLDEEQIAPGELFQEAIQRAIPRIKSAVICIGSQGLGKWQEMELYSLTSQFINRNIKVIPLLLPNVNRIPENLVFLQQFNWVSFESIDDKNAFYKLEWGITGVKPKPEQRLSNSKFPSQATTTFLPALAEVEPGEVELTTEKGDYTELRDLLAAGKWKEADQETFQIMLKVANREEQGWLNKDSIDNFPCEDLRIIDRLWVKYSNGKFGFSVQKKIYEELPIVHISSTVWHSFRLRLGWERARVKLEKVKVYSQQNHAPKGFFPRLPYNQLNIISLLSRKDL